MALALLQEMRLSGQMGDRVHAGITQWLLPAPGANPGIFDVYLRRDRGADPGLSARDGEYLGKYLVSAILLFRMQRDPRLRSTIESVLFRLYAAQGEDGYLGVFPEDSRMASRAPDGSARADLWNHYHVMMALYLWNKTTNSLQAMERLTRAANYLCGYFAPGAHALNELGCPELDLCMMHTMALLYRATGDENYFDLWKRMSEYFAQLEGHENFFTMLNEQGLDALPVNDASLLYAIDSLYTLHYMLGEEHYVRALYSQYQKLRLHSRLPNGGYGHHGHSVPNPYGPWEAETCSTAAWTQLCTDTLRAVRSPAIADELELTVFNAALGALHPSGRYAMSLTPMTGYKRPAVGCSSPLCGAPEFNCCAADGPRALGMISQWGVFADGEEVYLNYYGASSIVLQLDSGRLVHITQTTDYPRSGRIAMTVTTQRAITLHLRIPAWSRNNSLSVDGRPIYDTERGTYYALPVAAGTVQLELELELALHYWEGDGETVGRHALYCGPLLLCFDRHFNPDWLDDEPPVLDYGNMRYEPVSCDDFYPPIKLLRFTARDGSPVLLSDYASSGHYGTHIQSWLTIRRAPMGSVWR